MSQSQMWDPSSACDPEAEARSGTHAVSCAHPSSRGSAAPGLTLTLSRSRSHTPSLGAAPHLHSQGPPPLPATTFEPLALTPIERAPSGRSERSGGSERKNSRDSAAKHEHDGSDVERATPKEEMHDEATTVVGEEDKDGYVDPGLWGWLDCLGAVLVNMICYGMTQSWGVFQEYYSTHTLSTSSGMAISWIGAIQMCLMPMLGCIAGPLFDAGYLKHLIVIGGGLYSFCFMMASISTEYYQVLLSHGIGVGVGMGLIFSPSVSTLQHHFARSRYRTLAYGFQASGSAVAGIYFPICLNYLLPAVGFAWTMRILGFIIILFAVAAFITLSTTVPPRDEIAVLSPTVFRNPAYGIYVTGGCFASLAIYAPQTFGVTYATSKGVPVGIANYTVTISNGVSLIGRILPLFFAQRLGPINVLMTAAFISGGIQLMWTLARSTVGILVYDAMYGITSGAYGASLNPGAATFAPHTNQSGLYLGMCFFVTSWFWLAGTPITAQLIDKFGYLAASMFTGAVVLLAGTLICVSRFVRAKQVGTQFV